MSLRTPLGKVLGMGSAKSGTSHFWLQRLTAIANVPLIVFLVIFIIAMNGASQAELAAAIANPVIAILLMATVVSVVWHMKLGMQVIIEDYVHGEGTKLLALLGNSFFSILVGLAAIFAILRLSFGA